MSLKIAIATICLNEEKFAARFMESAKEADGIFVLDTGSIDKTVSILREHGAVVATGIVKPWRFDIPRNIAHSMVPADYDIVVSIDLDEVLTPGWADAIRAVWTPQTTRLRYQYAWSHDEHGQPNLTFWYDKIVQRKNYRWVKPVHEVLAIYDQPEVQTWCEGFMLHHWPDNTKSRGSYLGLLELAVKEMPDDDRSSHYYGRELMYYTRFNDAITELKRHLALPSATWNSERAASMRFISKSYLELGNMPQAVEWAMKAVIEAPAEREPWVYLARASYHAQDLLTTYYASKKALAITERPKSYINEPEAWGFAPWDYLSVSAWSLGHKQEALDAAQVAHEIQPSDQRLLNNLHAIKAGIQS